MPSLPAVFVELKASTEQFRAQFGEAKKVVDDFGKNATTGMQKVEQVGKMAFIGLAGAATAFAGIAIKAALDGERAHAQLASAVSNTGTSFQSVSPAVEEMSKQFAKFGYENDQVEEALARLVQGTGNVQSSMREMGLVADFARGRNVDLATAATVVGKVMAGNVGALSRLGISAKDAAGNTMSAAQALAMLHERFGGAAAAQADTYAGKLQAMNAEWHNMTEAVGNALLPVLANLAGGIANVVGWMDHHRELVLAVAGAVAGPLTAAMTVYAAKQAVTFGTAVLGSIQKLTTAIFGIAPAAEAAAAAETGLAVTTALATGGLTLLGAGAGLLIAHLMGQSGASDDAAGSVDAFGHSLDGAAGSEGDLGEETDSTTGSLKKQADLFKQLNGDVNAQQGEILKLIGDQSALANATETLKNTTKANSAETKFATQHAKDLKQANEDLEKANKAVTKAVDDQRVAHEKLNKLLAPQKPESITAAADAHEAANDRLTRANIAVTDKQKAFNAAVAEFGPNSEEATLANLDLNDALREVHAAQTDVTSTMDDLRAAQRQTIGTTDEITQATQDAKDADDGVTKAQIDQKDAQEKLNTVLKDDGAIKAAVQDAKDLASNTQAWQQATLQQNTDFGNLKKLIEDHPEMRDNLVAQIKAMRDNLPKGADTKPLDDLLSKITNTATQNLSPLSGVLTPLAVMAYAGIPGANITPTGGLLGGTDLSALFSDTPHRQGGGPVRAGSAYIVGEGGPELFLPGQSGTVVSNGGMGGVTINIYGNGRDDRELALAVRDELVNIGRNNVGVLS